MAQALMPPAQEAQPIFDQLGYSASEDRPDMLAERRWRMAYMTALSSRGAVECRSVLADGDTETPYRFRYFVTWDDHISTPRERLYDIDLPHEQTIAGVSNGDGNDYEVAHGMST